MLENNQAAVPASLNDIQINSKDSCAVNYARCRYAIEANLPNRAEKRLSKLAVVEHLQGKLEPSPDKKHPHKIVVFPDHTRAKF